MGRYGCRATHSSEGEGSSSGSESTEGSHVGGGTGLLLGLLRGLGRGGLVVRGVGGGRGASHLVGFSNLSFSLNPDGVGLVLCFASRIVAIVVQTSCCFPGIACRISVGNVSDKGGDKSFHY